MTSRALGSIVAIVCLGLLAYPATAQTDDAAGLAMALKSQCKADYARRCTGNDPPAAIAAACLSQYYINLSIPCRAALDAYKGAATTTAPAEAEP
jgi:hypothetical protein